MSDTDKLDKIQGTVNKYVDWAKNNAILVGVLTTLVPAVFVGGYTAITELNKAKDALAQFKDMVDNYGSIQGDLKTLKVANENMRERIIAQADTLSKVQEKASDALLDARVAKNVAESADKNTKSQIGAIRVEVQSSLDAVKTEMNSLKRATTNPLGR